MNINGEKKLLQKITMHSINNLIKLFVSILGFSMTEISFKVTSLFEVVEPQNSFASMNCTRK